MSAPPLREIGQCDGCEREDEGEDDYGYEQEEEKGGEGDGMPRLPLLRISTRAPGCRTHPHQSDPRALSIAIPLRSGLSVLLSDLGGQGGTSRREGAGSPLLGRSLDGRAALFPRSADRSAPRLYPSWV